MKPRDIPNLKRLLMTMKYRHDVAIMAGAYERTVAGVRGYEEKSYEGKVARKLIGSLERVIEEIERRKS